VPHDDPNPKPTLELQSYKPRPASAEDMTAFHSEEYISFLQSVTPENKVCPAVDMGRLAMLCMHVGVTFHATASLKLRLPMHSQEEYAKQMQIFNVGDDCPVFSRQFEYCQVCLTKSSLAESEYLVFGIC